MNSSTPFFSIIIPTLNEEKYLPLLLKDLTTQTFLGPFEVIVVDGSSEDNTKKMAETYAQKLNLIFITVSKRNVSFQRNTGGKKAKGQWLVFMDADNTVPPYFFDGLKYQIEKNKRIEIFTVWLDPGSYSKKLRPIIDLFNIWLELYSKLKPSAPGAMIGVKKKIFMTTRFDENVRISEDFAFITEAVKQGYSFGVLKEPRYTTSLRRFKKDTLKHLYSLSQIFISELKGDRYSESLTTHYPMLGGTYYETKSPSNKIVSKLQKLLKNFEI